jgi:hypothetical protein
MEDDEILALLDLAALEKVRMRRRELVEITARRLSMSARPSGLDLDAELDHEAAKRALFAVEAEITKRRAVM